ncbi:MAG: DUF3990 domain-containing protein [Spirochaetaceae bacterium]|jgi:hypothetical protein|nr:DUF3990 domain-containing protein [Spirochaetaceae bacterium]
MTLFHGGTMIIQTPEIIKTEYGRDFGVGFYTTDIKEQSVRWALRKARLEKRKKETVKAIVSIYEFDEKQSEDLQVIHFPEPSAAWLDMVCNCRGNSRYTHGYDIVTGKIANDSVGETVSYVMRGIMRREDALERLQFEKINNQICFASEKALSCLRYLDFEDCDGA